MSQDNTENKAVPVHVLRHEFGVKAFRVKCDGCTRGSELIFGHVNHAWSERLPPNKTHKLVFVTQDLGEMYQFDLNDGFITVIQKILGFSAVYTDDAQQELSAETKSHGNLFLSNNCACFVRQKLGLVCGRRVCEVKALTNRLPNICLERLSLGQLTLIMCSQPDARERATTAQDRFAIEHRHRGVNKECLGARKALDLRGRGVAGG